MISPVLDRHIEITPGVVGGRPRIAGHRITVQNVAIWHEQMGKSVDEISSEYNLSLSEVYAALSYYFDYKAIIDQQIAEDNALVHELRRNSSSPLAAKLQALAR